MDIKLINNETILNRWNYSKDKSNLGKEQQELVLTNRRILNITSSKKGCNIEQILIEDANGITSSHSKDCNILMLIIGIFTVGYIIGIFFIIKSFQESFKLNIYTNRITSTGLSIGVSSIMKKKRNKKIKRIKVNKNDAIDIIENIGAAIINAQDNLVINN